MAHRRRRAVKDKSDACLPLTPTMATQHKTQDYSVEVNIIEAADIIGKNQGGSADPYIKLKCCGKSRKTKTFKHITGNCIFNETMQFELKNVNILELMGEKLVISMRDSEGFGQKDVLYGEYEMSLGTIYQYNEQHEYYQKWIGLSDVKSHGVQARVKLSVTVLAHNDNRPEHAEEEGDDDAEEEQQVRKETVLEVNLYKVEDVRISNKQVCFELDYYGFKTNTSVGKVNAKGFILQGLRVPVAEPVMNPHIKLTMQSRGLMAVVGQGDDSKVAATINLHYEAIRAARIKPTWVNMYACAPATLGMKTTKEGRMMNLGHAVGVAYAGKVLLSAKVVERAHAEIKDYKKPFTARRPPPPTSMKYVVQFDLYNATEIDYCDKVYVEISCGSYSRRSAALAVVDQQVSHFAPLPELECKLSAVIDQCPDIFVYLINGTGHKFAFLRFPFKKVAGKMWKVPPKWHYMNYDGVDSDFDPAILFSLRCGPASRKPPRPYLVSRPLVGHTDIYSLGMYDALKPFPDDPEAQDQQQEADTESKLAPSPIKKKSKRPPTVSLTKLNKIGTLVLTIHEARHLPVRKRLPTTSCRARIGTDQKQNTPYVAKETDPKYEEKLTFENVSLDQPLVLEIWKRNRMMGEQIIANVAVDLMAQNELAVEKARAADPTSRAKVGSNFKISGWFPLNNETDILGFDNAVVSITVEFNFYEMEEAARVERSIFAKEKRARLKNPLNMGRRNTVMYSNSAALGRPSNRNFQLRLHVYLARNIPLGKSTKPKAVIDVRCSGQHLQSEPCISSADPMWFTTMCTNISLAVPLELAPDILARVTDGKGGEVLAEFVIPAKQARIQNNSLNTLTPAWYQLRDGDNVDIAGARILAAVQLLTAEEGLRAPIPETLRPTYEDKFLEVVTLGIRNLHQGMGVYKPFVAFKVETDGEVEREVTSSSKSENMRNPVFCAVNHLKIAVPIGGDMKFAPAVEVDVRDKGMVSGLGTQIGSSSINLEDVQMRQDKHEAKAYVTGEQKLRDCLFAQKQAERKRSQEKKAKSMQDRRLRTQQARAKAKRKRGKSKKEEKMPLLDNELGGDVELDELDDEWPDFETDSDDSEAETDLPVHLRGNRITIKDDLEDVLDLEPFHSLPLYYGSFYAGLNQIGMFKGLFRIVDKIDYKMVKEKLKALKPKKMMLRLYVFEGHNLRSKNSEKNVNPFVNLKMAGETVYKGKEHAVEGTLNPQWYTAVEDIPVEIPGAGEIKITVMDAGTLRDIEIGSTSIDVDNRYFAMEWSKLKKKPIEHRALMRGTMEQGKISVLMELYTPETAGRIPPMVILKPEIVVYELRVCIWSVRNIIIDGEIPEKCDPLVKVALQGVANRVGNTEVKLQKKTDYHAQAKLGNGNFNYRIKFQLQLPPPPHSAWPRLQFAVYDHNTLSSSQALCLKTIPLKAFCRKAMKERKERSYYYASPELENRNWVSDLKSPNARDCTAEVDVSIEMMPMDVAEQYKNGNGREGPNVYPNLPPPEGRETVMSRAAGAIQGAGRKYFWNYLKKLFAMYACYALGCLALAIFVYNYIMCDRCLF